MSKMNELSVDYDAYDDFVESERMELRREGAEELRIEITRALEAQMSKALTSQEKYGLQVAAVVVAQANI